MVLISLQNLMARSGPSKEVPRSMNTKKDKETQEKRHPNGKVGIRGTQLFPATLPVQAVPELQAGGHTSPEHH